MANELIGWAVDIEIDAIAKKVVVVNAQSIRGDQGACYDFRCCARVRDVRGKHPFGSVDPCRDQADAKASILLEDVVLKIIVVADRCDHPNDKVR